MNRSRLVLLGLCFAGFSLMAFSATVAQAETGARWLVLKAGGGVMTEAELGAGSVNLVLEAETTQVLHTKIAGVAVLILCKSFHILNAPILPLGSISTGSVVHWLECVTHLNGAVSAPCEPRAGGKKGVITSNPLHGLLLLHELAGGVKDDVLRMLPDSGETFVTIVTSEECSIGEKIPIIGKMTLKDCENLALTHLVKHLFEVGPLTELWAISKTAEHVVTLLGSYWVSLGGAGAGRAWSGDPA